MQLSTILMSVNMSSAILEMQDERSKSLFAMCDINSLCEVTLVGDDGRMYAHKLILLKVFPELRYLLCALCHDDHENITILVPGVKKSEIKLALKNLYLSSDYIKLGYILGLDVDILPDINDDLVENSEQTTNKSDEKNLERKENPDPILALNSCSEPSYAHTEFVKREQVKAEGVVASTKLQENIQCEQCDFKANDEQKLLEHKYVEHQIDKCPEEKCSFSTFEDAILKAHIFVKHEVQIYCCDVCEFEIETGKALRAHKEMLHESSVYKCDQCEYKIQIQENADLEYTMFMSHKIDEHKVSLFSCKLCEYKTTNENNHRNHNCRTTNKRRQRLPLPKDLKCDMCDYKPSSPSRMGLKVHMESVHLGIKHYCKQCDFAASTRANLLKHMKIVHEGQRFKCDQCEFSSHIKKVVTNHDAYTHKGITHECADCDYVGKSFTNLKVHIKWQHERKFVCSECENRFPYLADLRKHIKNKHMGNFCDICQYQTKNEGDLKKHNDQLHNGITYMCKDCGYISVSKLNLKLHVENDHKPLKPSQNRVKRFKCKQCEYMTATRPTLKDHYFVQHEGKRFHCDQCDYKAKSKMSVRNHRSVIHEGKTFDCNRCEFKSSNYANLRNHRQTVHEGKVHNCDKCDYTGSSEQTLLSHKRQKHDRHINCKMCDFKCGSMPYLKDHMLAKHALDAWIASQGLKAIEEPKLSRKRTGKSKSQTRQRTSFQCEKCEFQSKNIGSLKNHMFAKHEVHHKIKSMQNRTESAKLFKCANCIFTAEDKQLIELHIVKVHPCQCNQCNFESGYIDELKVHIIEEHSGNFCEPCSYQAKTEQELHYHNSNVHDGIPYPCEKCGYCAPSQISLLAHIETNHDLDENDASFNNLFFNVNSLHV